MTGIGEPYDNIQNFGRISLVNSAYLNYEASKFEQGINFQIWDNMTMYNRQKNVYLVPIFSRERCQTDELRATLVWTDPPAIPFCSKCVLNDLDLTLRRVWNKYLYYPNGLDKSDRVNNAERVIIHDVSPSDAYEIIVTATNLAVEPHQFSLVVSGCINQPDEPLENWRSGFWYLLRDDWFIVAVVSPVVGLLTLSCCCLYQYSRYRKIEGQKRAE